MVYASVKGCRGALPGARVPQKQIRKKCTSPLFSLFSERVRFWAAAPKRPESPPPPLLTHACDSTTAKVMVGERGGILPQ